MLRLEQLYAHLGGAASSSPSRSLAQPVAKSSGKVYRGARRLSAASRLSLPPFKQFAARTVVDTAVVDAGAAAAVVGLGFIGSGDDVSGAAIGQATIGEPVQTPFHSGGYASFPERIELVCGATLCCAYQWRPDQSPLTLLIARRLVLPTRCLAQAAAATLVGASGSRHGIPARSRTPIGKRCSTVKSSTSFQFALIQSIRQAMTCTLRSPYTVSRRASNVCVRPPSPLRHCLCSAVVSPDWRADI